MNVKAIPVSASAVIKTSGCYICGIIVNSHSSGTLKINDAPVASPAGGNPIVMDTFTFPAGSGMYMFPNPIQLDFGCYATVGGTLNCHLLIGN